MKKLVIIDGKSVFYRAYYAMGNLSLPDGTPTGAVYGFAAMAIEILGELKPDYVAVAWDKAKTNIRSRKKIYEGYKAGRKPAPPDFYVQVPLLQELLEALHWPLYECDDYEADDIMGTLACEAVKADVCVDLVSSDLDMLQIVDKNIEMYQLKRGFSDVTKFDVAAVEKKYGLKRDQFLDLKAIKGDSSDNIPGVPGIGEKGAVKLLQEYETLDGIYEHVDEIKGAIHDKLVAGKDSAYMSKELGEIRFDAPVPLKLEEMAVSGMDVSEVIDGLRKLEFRSLMKKFSDFVGAHKTESAGEDEKEEKVEENSEVSDLPKGVFVDWDVKGVWHKEELSFDELPKKVWDLGQGEFLLNPLRSAKSLEGYDGEIAKEYHSQLERFEKLPKLKRVAEELDMPLIPVLYKMEKTGVKIDVVFFTTLSDEFGKRLREIEQKIYSFIGHPFNINSPKQLSEVFYGELGLTSGGKTKVGKVLSTGKKELERLRGEHPIVTEVENYRELAKLKSTYVDALPKLADEEGRVHTTYTQNVTATGRLSSVNPNLQNIPVRTEEGRRIREGFVADRGKVFVSADYAQFELRLAAAMAGDERLIADFNAGLDIHTKTASDIFHVPMDKVTSDQRRAAKTINFGVLYGMSAKGLSDAAGMSVTDAKMFIEKYFEVRKPIREYLDGILKQARDVGYVETLFGRRRPTPDVKSPNYAVRAAAERAAMNMPIQGTEADLMKKAMLAVDKEMEGLILQVHDSLIVECDKKDAERVSKKLRELMEKVAPEISVKLEVDVSTGKNWGEL